MALDDDLVRIASVAAVRGPVTGVLAAEPWPGRRAYLVAIGADDERRWLVLGDDGAVAEEREAVREVAAIVAMCELADDVAGGGDLATLRARLEEVRLSEAPPGIEEAEVAARDLERAVGSPPRVASPAHLDRVGELTRRLELALGEHASPFAAAVASSSPAVEAFVGDVQARYLAPLR